MAEGRVLEILIAPDGGAPMVAVARVEALPGAGLAGDRYAAGRGTFSDRPGGGRHVTLVDIAAAAAAGVPAAALRRNLVVEGVDLDALVGADIRIGEVLVRGVRPCPPCSVLERSAGRPDLRKSLAGRGGLRVDVLEGGTITVGDAVAAVTADAVGTPRMLAE